MAVTFHGVRGSTPCHGTDIVRFGGNTSCVSVSIPDAHPIVFDLGTGLRYFGAGHDPARAFAGTFLLSHLHWDHIQGLPFFAPLLTDDADVTVYAPEQDGDVGVRDVFVDTIRPPLFPIEFSTLPGTIRFREVLDDEFVVGEAGGHSINVMSRSIPHIGRTLGYRVEWNGASVAYLSDHQMPVDGSFEATAGARELCRDVDLLIHDAQYTGDEFAEKAHWGHCTVEYAVWLAAETGVRRIALFHHDPAHHDDMLDRLVAEAAAIGRERDVDVVGAREGLTLSL